MDRFCSLGVIEEVVKRPMTFDNKDYPVVYFKSDTTGEKAYEEFYVSAYYYTYLCELFAGSLFFD